MKKILAIVLFLGLLCSSAYAQTEATARQQLMGLGMSAELATKVASLAAGADSVYPNNSYLLWRNAANSANVSVLAVDSSDDTYLKSASGRPLRFSPGGTLELTASDDSLVYTAPTAFTFTANTADGTDTSKIGIGGGGSTSFLRGSFITLEGADVGGASAGRLQLGTGGGNATMDVNGTTLTTWSSTAFTSSAFIRSSNTTDIGWSVVAGANTACNTTCTSACVVGFDTAVAPTPVACTDATADTCLCAGAS